MDIVRAGITKKYGKGALIDTKKKNDKWYIRWYQTILYNHASIPTSNGGQNCPRCRR
jgi:hypothetical protein